VAPYTEMAKKKTLTEAGKFSII